MDEPILAGWQSGVLWADMTPKPSYQPFKDAVRRVAAGRVDCALYAKLSAESSPDIGFTTPARTRTTSGAVQ
jgi:hypothetical protein